MMTQWGVEMPQWVMYATFIDVNDKTRHRISLLEVVIWEAPKVDGDIPPNAPKVPYNPVTGPAPTTMKLDSNGLWRVSQDEGEEEFEDDEEDIDPEEE